MSGSSYDWVFWMSSDDTKGEWCGCAVRATCNEKVCVLDHSAYTGMGVKTKYGLLGAGGVYIPTSPRLNDL